MNLQCRQNERKRKRKRENSDYKIVLKVMRCDKYVKNKQFVTYESSASI